MGRMRVLGLVTSIITSFAIGLSPAAWAEDQVSEVQKQLLHMQTQARQLDMNLAGSQSKLESTQRDLAITEQDLADQEQLVKSMRVQAGRVATAAYQRSTTMDIAGLLFSSEDQDSFMDDVAIMTSVTALTEESLKRLQAEESRLSDLRSSQESMIQAIDEEIQRQQDLKNQYDSVLTSSTALVNSLTSEQRTELEELMAQAIRDATDAQLKDAIAEGGNRVSRDVATLNSDEKPVWPADGSITSPFGYRSNPVGGYSELHDGTDIGAPCGAPIVSAWSGVVLSARVEGGWGNRVIVDSGTYKAAYNHMSSIAVSPGQIVKAGDVVGAVGTTGLSTGCHLHFSVWVDGQITDPVTVFDSFE